MDSSVLRNIKYTYESLRSSRSCVLYLVLMNISIVFIYAYDNEWIIFKSVGYKSMLIVHYSKF